jgi:hypothetical protein
MMLSAIALCLSDNFATIPLISCPGLPGQLQHVFLHARATGHERFCWFVLNDNMLAQSFYRTCNLRRSWYYRSATFSVIGSDAARFARGLPSSILSVAGEPSASATDNSSLPSRFSAGGC